MAPSKPSRKTLYLIDAMAYIFRAYYAPTPQRFATADGTPTQAVFLFHNMLRKLLRDHAPDYVAVVYDSRGPTVRDEIFTEYKAQREPMPDDLAEQMPFISRLCEALQLPILQQEGYEADDILGALALLGSAAGLDTVVVTSDKDLLQLVNTKPKGKHGPIRVFSPTRDLFYDEEGVEEYFGVTPDKVVDVLALMGDAVDNIPGAKGIGEKGARELINNFGSVEKAMKGWEKVKQKRYREALRDQQEQIRMSKQLATLHTNLDIPLDLDALTLREPDADELVELYSELGFTSLLKEQLSEQTAKPAKTSYRELGSAEELKAWLKKQAKQTLAFWCETSGTPPLDFTITALGFSHQEGEAVFLLLPEAEGLLATGQEERREALTVAGEFLADAKSPKIVHDLKATHLALHSVGLELNGAEHDTALYSYLVQPTTAKHSLEDVAARRLNLKPSGSPAEKADFVLRLWKPLRKEVEGQNLIELYETLERPLSPVLAAMEREGIRLDPKVLKKMSREFAKDIEALTKKIYKLCGTEFNLNSPKQLSEVLFEKLQLPVPARRGKTKTPSTAADVLEELAHRHEVPGLVLSYRELAKLKSTYIDALPELLHPETGRIHTSFNQFGTSTGRLSSSDPNLQNIPIRSEYGNRIRAAFVAAPGCVLLGADYSQIELRVLAHLSQDKVLCDAFQRGEDVHARTAEEVLGIAPLAQTGEHRRIAKMINFGIVYGLTAFGLAARLGIPQGEARQYIEAYFKRYAGVKEYSEEILRETRETGLTRTLFGRVRPIPEINSRNPAQRNFAERTALNSPIQGTAADLIKLAMIRIFEKLREAGLLSRLLAQIHDELLFEVPIKEISTLTKIVRPSMENVIPLRVPLVVNIATGSNWGNMYPLT